MLRIKEMVMLVGVAVFFVAYADGCAIVGAYEANNSNLQSVSCCRFPDGVEPGIWRRG